jgi:hypothetical protein
MPSPRGGTPAPTPPAQKINCHNNRSGRVVLTVRRSLPVYPERQTISEPVSTSRHLRTRRKRPFIRSNRSVSATLDGRRPTGRSAPRANVVTLESKLLAPVSFGAIVRCWVFGQAHYRLMLSFRQQVGRGLPRPIRHWSRPAASRRAICDQFAPLMRVR